MLAYDSEVSGLSRSISPQALRRRAKIFAARRRNQDDKDSDMKKRKGRGHMNLLLATNSLYLFQLHSLDPHLSPPDICLGRLPTRCSRM